MNADEPLTPEERALAERLRQGRQALPSAALDASILAAARTAVAASAGADTPQPQPPPAASVPAPRAAAPLAADAADPGARPRRRAGWPAWTGLAASLTLAVGIAWQLRPPAPPVVPAPPLPQRLPTRPLPSDRPIRKRLQRRRPQRWTRHRTSPPR
ncbi:hypothetical protein A6R71_07915 [Xanthomonas translucens pv. arrhenatheri]|uniref:Uncharacterized protein n=1 Tax=Xanthomonas graminis pv. arrhenatheri LMG 727 TaxID=1195923 RepID=A0A0K2ZTI3_9XANT|nr:hypothetical protein [Xanthomonas translucens]OAX65432.1 hypothetical protein A6R71_07915 [Xanthomonas translucens pv. arrhenatheri]UKE75916.1 hypothetical protein KM317_10330 [Xanthomonas translucens pv. arrhenatheri]CTP89071.1 hypothetical protein XTALMG727_2590 [Xanthomonas translucens pv. arrhenatheri LMG 727]